MSDSSQKSKIIMNSPHFSPTEFIQNLNHTGSSEEMTYILSRAFEQVREEQNSHFFQTEQDNHTIKQDLGDVKNTVTTLTHDVAEIKQDVIAIKETLTHTVTHEQLDARLTLQEAKFDVRFNYLDDKFNQLDDKFNQLEIKFNQLEIKFNHLEDKFNQLEIKFNHLDDKFNHLAETFKFYATKEYVHLELNKTKWQIIGSMVVLFIVPYIGHHFGL